MRVTKNNYLYALLALFIGFAAIAQQNPIQTSIDSAKIKIGAQANLTLKATVNSKDRVNFPEGKVFGQLEVLESYPVDTVKKGSIYELVKKYGITQFDSGRYVIPRLPVVINNKTLQTDSLVLEVAPVQVDTLKQKMYDIKPVATGESFTPMWVWILLGIVVLAALGFAGWWFFLRNKKPAEKKKPEVVVSPIEKATAELQNLEKKELLQQGAVKEYYSELADIARMYIEEAIHVPAMESTTGELIEAMREAIKRRKMVLKQETFEQLEKVLRTADMVKFAKSRPLDFEIADDRSRIEQTIVVIDRSIPEDKPDEEDTTQAWLEAKRLKEEAKRKKQRRNMVIVGACVVVFAVSGYFGYTFVRGLLYGESTKEMLEGSWVKSEYGVPGVTIETPHVLKRLDPSTLMPKDSYALFKDMAMFGDGKPFGDFYIAVATLNMKEPKDVDLGTVIEGVIKTWEGNGAEDILVKDEEFRTPNGITGKRAYGTMAYPDPLTKQSRRLYYEVYVFGQQQGLQEITILHKEGDEYAPKIMERIKNSIEMRNLNPNQQQQEQQEQPQ
ncbi:hypothetical protein ACLI1A_03025 [Flavobacterium sp. RHBU_3]|uniref:hypothetical protein n=1 Tax=Flavobacterium sp. RHBU_3 TaxID=3391184 RepID=UPI003984AD70